MSVIQRLLPATGDETGRFVVIAAGLAALNGLLFGFDTGVISGALLYIGQTFPALEASAFFQGAVVSSSLVGAAIGAATGGRLADLIGRRRLIFAGASFFFVGSLGMAISPSVTWLIISRLIDGIGIGFASVVGPLYISEIAPPEIRGSLVTLNQVAITGGILVSYISNYVFTSAILDAGLTWRVMLGTGMVPAVVLFVGLLFLPESSRWLVEQGHEKTARSVLSRIRNGTGIEEEMKEIERMTELEEAGVRELAKPWVRPVLIVGVGLAIFQQATGINAVVYYAPTILEATGFSDVASLVGTIGIGAINVALSIVAALLLDRVGRRRLLLLGLVGMLAALLTLGGAYYLSGLSGILGMLAVATLMLFVACHAVSIGSVFWLIVSEIYPLNVRGTAMGVCTIVLWATNFTIAQLFPILFDVGPAFAFWSFAAVTAVALVFTYHLVPETKGRSLEEIEADLRETAVGDEEIGIADQADESDPSSAP